MGWIECVNRQYAEEEELMLGVSKVCIVKDTYYTLAITLNELKERANNFPFQRIEFLRERMTAILKEYDKRFSPKKVLCNEWDALARELITLTRKRDMFKFLLKKSKGGYYASDKYVTLAWNTPEEANLSMESFYLDRLMSDYSSDNYQWCKEVKVEEGLLLPKEVFMLRLEGSKVRVVPRFVRARDSRVHIGEFDSAKAAEDWFFAHLATDRISIPLLKEMEGIND